MNRSSLAAGSKWDSHKGIDVNRSRLTYNHKGRPERIDQNEGNPYMRLLDV